MSNKLAELKAKVRHLNAEIEATYELIKAEQKAIREQVAMALDGEIWTLTYNGRTINAEPQNDPHCRYKVWEGDKELIIGNVYTINEVRLALALGEI